MATIIISITYVTSMNKVILKIKKKQLKFSLI
jgi:hypothetical protein